MFPTFIPYIFNAASNNVSPCAVDVVGNGLNPALAFGFSATHIAFRLRLNCDPRKSNPQTEIEEHRWGVEIKDINGNLLFTVEVDGKNNKYFVAIRNSNFATIYTESIVLGTNVDVTQVTGIASCNGQPPLDSDFLLDFQMPLSRFIRNNILFDLSKEVVQFCFYTTTCCDDNNINKEDPDDQVPPCKCGKFINVPLTLTKLCPIPPAGGSFIVDDDVTIILSVSNTSMVTATNVTVVDLLNIPTGVTISSLTTLPLAITIIPPAGPYVGNIDITTMWTGLTIPAQSALQLSITFTILDAPIQTTNITNIDAGIGQLSGINNFRCTIPVSMEITPPTRGVKFYDLKF
ncbi:MAG: hypothetical protein K0R09_2670 [Clostridiales bacterium]|jgi:uncharacterized repeat protein (TIGR01451 family)|nr:hypothetical protein [Clostridiales bacterium]